MSGKSTDQWELKSGTLHGNDISYIVLECLVTQYDRSLHLAYVEQYKLPPDEVGSLY